MKKNNLRVRREEGKKLFNITVINDVIIVVYHGGVITIECFVVTLCERWGFGMKILRLFPLKWQIGVKKIN